MFEVNKKMWSFNFGCILAASSVWLVALGMQMPVLTLVDLSPAFIDAYYSVVVTSVFSILLTFLVITLMKRGFNIRTSDHTFWLLLPLIIFVLMALLTGAQLYSPLLAAAVPALTIVLFSGLFSSVTSSSAKSTDEALHLAKAGE